MHVNDDTQFNIDVIHLFDACQEGHKETVQRLINVGVDVNSRGDQSITPLKIAAANGQLVIVEWLLSLNGKDPKGWGDFDAASHDREILVPIDDVDELNEPYYWTALMHAASNGHERVVEFLAKSGAAVNKKNGYGLTAMALAAEGGHFSIVRLLVEQFDAEIDLDTVYIALVYGHQPLFTYLVEKSKFDVNARSANNELTLLMMAALCGNITVCQYLVDRGADANLKNANLDTAHDVAKKIGFHEVAQFLRPLTKIEESSFDSMSIVDIAGECRFDNVKKILALESTLADFVRETDGATVLMFAAIHGRIDVINALLRIGIDINRQEFKAGWSALMQAVFYSKPGVVRLFLCHGADVKLMAHDGSTAYSLALQYLKSDAELLDKLNPVSKPNRRPKTSKIGSQGSVEGKSPTHMHKWLSKLKAKLGTPGASQHSSGSGPGSVTSETRRATANSTNHKRSASLCTVGNDSLAEVDGVQLTRRDSGSDDGFSQLLPPLFPAPEHQHTNKRMVSQADDAQSISQRLCIALQASENMQRRGPDSSPSPVSTRRHGAALLSPIKEDQLATTGGASGRYKNNRRKPPPLLMHDNQGVMKPGNSKQRPHSYHNEPAGKTVTFANSQTFRQAGPNRNSEPASYGSELLRLEPLVNDLPITPTQQTIGFFTPGPSTSGVKSPKLFSSIPLLSSTKAGGGGSQSASPNSSSNGSTPAKRVVHSASYLTVANSSGQGTNSSAETIKIEEDDIERVLKELELAEYHSLFLEQEIDLETFLTLSDSDLREIGIEDASARNAMLHMVRSLNHDLLQNNQNLLKRR